ncbi:glycosyltransferase [Cellulomonas sp.]|uniref:glycosyltransferase family 2 protein n=1 Tax=Cellulomonas sp. TaxID=40001 RepID=UPI00344D6EF7
MTRKRGNSADNDAADMTPASDDSLVLPAAAEDLAAVDGSGPVKVRARRASRRRAGSTEPLTEATTKEPGTRSRQRVAVVIPAKDESRRIAATVRAARAIPRVDLVLVVDDGSEDSTQHVARDAGAVVVRHSHNRGKAAAMETGAAVVAMRDTPDRPPRLLLFIDGDLGESAVNTAPLVPPVLEGSADFSIALLPPQVGAGGRGIVVGAARRAIASMTGWTPTQPLSGMRCLTREAFEAATPLARGWGVETGMTIDLLRQGFTAVEVPCELRHRPSGTDLRGQLHRAAQYRDVQLAVSARRVRRAAGAVRATLTPGASRPTGHR